MTKTRISISLEQEQAERIRRHAERAGPDVSAYLVHAATRQMAESEAIEAQFADVDTLIAAAEAEAAGAPQEEAAVGALTEQERREVEAALDLVYGTGRPARSDSAA
ncbi:ribbon-helix-helix protein, CopG family [Streptomyces sp. NPDC091268]|uniref:ribbon-helix-helix protein, CopG family n=1 Tax=Streptomyces sp. NPDC091268 TaxID=3365979 RepID=UPI0038006027